VNPQRSSASRPRHERRLGLPLHLAGGRHARSAVACRRCPTASLKSRWSWDAPS
jgi:hypothetical protein